MDGTPMEMKYNKSDLEKKTSVFLDMFYVSLGGEIVKEAPPVVFDDWDKVVKFAHITYKIEEKSFNTIWDGLLVELVEDLTTGDLGWYYQTKADKIIYSFFENETKQEPSTIYVLAVPEMKKYVMENIKQLISKAKISDKGYGKTLFVVIPLEVGKRIYLKGADVVAAAVS